MVYCEIKLKIKNCLNINVVCISSPAAGGCSLFWWRLGYDVWGCDRSGQLTRPQDLERQIIVSRVGPDNANTCRPSPLRKYKQGGARIEIL